MKTTNYNTNRRTRRETFPDGSQLVRRAGGSYEIIEAQPNYGNAAREISSHQLPAQPARQRTGKPKPH